MMFGEIILIIIIHEHVTVLGLRKNQGYLGNNVNPTGVFKIMFTLLSAKMDIKFSM